MAGGFRPGHIRHLNRFVPHVIPNNGEFCKMYIRPLQKGLEAFSDALSAADMYPASDAAIVTPRARMVFADEAPNQRRVIDGTLLQAGSSDPVTRPLRPNVSLRSAAPTFSRPRRLMPLRPEPCTCTPAPLAPAWAACASASPTARRRIEPRHGRVA